jgi:hypothetical protein
VLTTEDPDLVAYNLLLLAHAWALKHWYFEQSLTFDEYVRKQTTLTLSALIEPKKRRAYRRFLE